jgi:putative Holliday junction resolvase
MSKKRIASIDFGLKRLGVAISDENKIVATSLNTVSAGKTPQETIRSLLEVLKPYDLERIVIGNPIHLNGKEGSMALEVKAHVTCEVSLFDERLTTALAERSLKESGMSRKKRSRVIDASAAILILQGYLGY